MRGEAIIGWEWKLALPRKDWLRLLGSGEIVQWIPGKDDCSLAER
jgi:hypothetical protein